jgi:hypothetical protein
MSFTGEPDVRDIQFTLMLVMELALGIVVWFLIATGTIRVPGSIVLLRQNPSGF